MLVKTAHMNKRLGCSQASLSPGLSPILKRAFLLLGINLKEWIVAGSPGVHGLDFGHDTAQGLLRSRARFYERLTVRSHVQDSAQIRVCAFSYIKQDYKKNIVGQRVWPSTKMPMSQMENLDLMAISDC